MEKRLFNIGLVLLLETSYKARLKTEVIGWKEGAYVITGDVHAGGQSEKLPIKEKCKVRFLMDDYAYGFESRILAHHTHPFPLTIIQYPERVESVKVQVAPRYKTNLPARLLDAKGALLAEVVIFDISDGGCAVRLQLQKGREFSPATTYSLAFTPQEQQVAVACVIRTVELGNDCFSLGMQFTGIAEEQRMILGPFLEQLKRQPEDTKTSPSAVS